MITRIEIDGFKSFTDFELDLEPLTLIAGVNGVGKSNLFDALLHLGRLVGSSGGIDGGTLREAFESDRGSLGDLFTLYPDGSRANHMRFAVELLLPDVIEDQFAVSAELNRRRLRYELGVRLSELGNLQLTHERLVSIPRASDRFVKLHPAAKGELMAGLGGQKTLVDTVAGEVVLYQDGRSGRKRRAFPVSKAQRTALSGLGSTEFPHAYAVRRMLTGLRLLRLEPSQLRLPSAFASSQDLGPSGYGLAAALARIKRSAPESMRDISEEVARVVPGIRSVDVEPDMAKEEWTVNVNHVDGHPLPAKLVSDGTLRLLALATMVHDPEYRGIVILEEPENGIYAGRIEELLDVLEAFSDSAAPGWGQRQLLTNTHSVPLVEAVKQRGLTDCLMFAYLKRVVRSDMPSHYATTVAHVFDTGQQQSLFSDDELNRQKVASGELDRLLRRSDTPGAL